MPKFTESYMNLIIIKITIKVVFHVNIWRWKERTHIILVENNI